MNKFATRFDLGIFDDGVDNLVNVKEFAFVYRCLVKFSNKRRIDFFRYDGIEINAHIREDFALAFDDAVECRFCRGIVGEILPSFC